MSNDGTSFVKEDGLRGGSASWSEDKISVARWGDYTVYIDMSDEEASVDDILQDGTVTVYDKDGNNVGTMEIRADTEKEGKIVTVYASKWFANSEACKAAIDLMLKTQVIDASVAQSVSKVSTQMEENEQGACDSAIDTAMQEMEENDFTDAELLLL